MAIEARNKDERIQELLETNNAYQERYRAAELLVEKLAEGLEKLTRLGNGDRLGNSDGNVIAQKYYEDYKQYKGERI